MKVAQMMIKIAVLTVTVTVIDFLSFFVLVLYPSHCSPLLPFYISCVPVKLGMTGMRCIFFFSPLFGGFYWRTNNLGFNSRIIYSLCAGLDHLISMLFGVSLVGPGRASLRPPRLGETTSEVNKQTALILTMPVPWEALIPFGIQLHIIL